MAKNSNIEERLKKEVEERVSYYEENEPPASEKMSKVHYILAAAVAVIGLAMIIIGAM